jgi:crotonobetainyl-CoA:carnitine CoA-transferase CaiB-like acyl-CoA transferase
MNIGPADIKDPIYLTGGIADQMGGIMLAYGVTMALVARERYGVGQEVNASHLGSMIALQGLNVSSRTFVGHEFQRNAREESFNPLWNHYKCSDGKWICLGMIQDRYWKDFCNAVGIPELIEDARFNTMRLRGKNRRELIAILDRVFAAKPRDQWMNILKHGGDFIYTIVNSIDDLPTDAQVLANGYVVDYEHPELGKKQVVGVPVILSETPGDARGRAPELGENTELILTELLGYSWEQIAHLREAGVI